MDLDDPLDRLMAIYEGTKGAKEEHNALGADTLLNWAEHATPNFFSNAARFYSRMRLAERHRPIANLVISNVPGPDFPLYLGGAELKRRLPARPGGWTGMGLNITIMSYRGVLYWGIIACPDSIPLLWNLTAAIPPALDELLEAAGEKPAIYRSEEAAAAVRASGLDVERPEPQLRPQRPASSRASTGPRIVPVTGPGPPPSTTPRCTRRSVLRTSAIPGGRGSPRRSRPRRRRRSDRDRTRCRSGGLRARGGVAPSDGREQWNRGSGAGENVAHRATGY